MTPALKEYEERVLTAAERIEARERELFEALRARGRARDRVGSSASRARSPSSTCCATLAEVAEREGYVRPTMTDDFDLEIVGGPASGGRADDAARQVHSERSAADRTTRG